VAANLSNDAYEFALEVRTSSGEVFRAPCTHPWAEADVSFSDEFPVRFDAARRVVVDVVAFAQMQARMEREKKISEAENVARALRG
jgi:hypothetical protein